MSNAPISTPTVLVIDDGAEERSRLSELLVRDGYTVQCAADGEGGIALVRERAADLVLLDQQMRGLDDLAVLEALKGDPTTAEIPVIVVSDTAFDRDVVKALELGAIDYVSRPFAVDILLARIRAALRSHREKQAIWRLGEDLRAAEDELSRARRGAAIGAIAAGLAHEINNPAAFVVTDLHEVRELARELADDGDEARSEALAALADEALLGMHRIRDVVRDLAVFVGVGADPPAPASGHLDLAAVVRRRAARYPGKSRIVGDAEPAPVPAGLGGEDELDALVGLLIRHASTAPDNEVVLTIERTEKLVCLHVAPTGEGRGPTSDALALIFARELAERFGGTLEGGSVEGNWILQLPRARP